MIDRKKVIKGVTNAIQIEKRNGKALVYLRISDAKDILSLLKEQEETELCDRCGRVRLKSKWEGRRSE